MASSGGIEELRLYAEPEIGLSFGIRPNPLVEHRLGLYFVPLPENASDPYVDAADKDGEFF
jgi:hypothetical protein